MSRYSLPARPAKIRYNTLILLPITSHSDIKLKLVAHRGLLTARHHQNEPNPTSIYLLNNCLSKHDPPRARLVQV